MGLGIATRILAAQRAASYAVSRGLRALSGPICPACGGRTFAQVVERPPFWLERCTVCGHGLTMPAAAPDRHARHHAAVYAWPKYVETYLRDMAPALTHSFKRGIAHIQAATTPETRGGRKARTLGKAAASKGARLPDVGKAAASEGERLLDVGCAFGFFLDMARGAGFDVKGIEVSGPLAAQAAARYGLDVEIGALADVREPPGSFDVVTMWDVLEHCADPLDTLKQCAGLLKPSGLFLARVPDFSFCSLGLDQGFVGTYIDQAYPLDLDQHAHHFSRESIRRFLAAAGLVEIDSWPSLSDEYTPKDDPEYRAVLAKMEELGVACEMSFLCRKEQV